MGITTMSVSTVVIRVELPAFSNSFDVQSVLQIIHYSTKPAHVNRSSHQELKFAQNLQETNWLWELCPQAVSHNPNASPLVFHLSCLASSCSAFAFVRTNLQPLAPASELVVPPLHHCKELSLQADGNLHLLTQARRQQD